MIRRVIRQKVRTGRKPIAGVVGLQRIVWLRLTRICLLLGVAMENVRKSPEVESQEPNSPVGAMVVVMDSAEGFLLFLANFHDSSMHVQCLTCGRLFFVSILCESLES